MQRRAGFHREMLEALVERELEQSGYFNPKVKIERINEGYLRSGAMIVQGSMGANQCERLFKRVSPPQGLDFSGILYGSSPPLGLGRVVLVERSGKYHPFPAASLDFERIKKDLCRQCVTEIRHQRSEEVMAEDIRAEGYEFFADGTLFRTSDKEDG